ncbi:uncharacterized protein LOC108739481 [Agrilus planipennis]|uniref:Uncharacterized protein LOC108739481 n=1 Tax=Agrilus planipennis TaxID=224129 RepID=A0A1W4WYG9_AGRPL|nr:uncharacterized protein LOC108739481 [Agrilus planipennis]
MGMITRVRGRLRSLHTLPKLQPEERDEKIAETVCLLSVLFLLPYCSKGHTPLLLKLGGVWLVTYSCLVLPVLISANYKYPVRWLRMLLVNIPGMFSNFFYLFNSYIHFLATNFISQFYFSLWLQLVFFMMCDRVLLCNFGGTNCPQKKLTGLYTLMFYNVLAYCVSYIKELIEKEDWSPYVNMTHHSNLKHVAMSATKIVLEWTKAVTFIITVTFMLLVFGLEQGLEHYQPTALYTIVTWTYYMCTEKVFVQFFPSVLVFLRLSCLEALEFLYAPVLLRYYTITVAALMGLILLFYGQFRFTFIATYLTVYLRTKDLVGNSLKQLKNEQAVLNQFRLASLEEIENWDDVCAVCLSPLNRARVTPCQHLFHADCLRQCLNSSKNCPICKREYTFIV